MDIEYIKAKNGPPAVGPYSHAVRAGQFIFISGQGPFSRDGSGPIKGSFSEQVEYTMENLKIILNECGCDFSDIVKISGCQRGARVQRIARIAKNSHFTRSS
mgnify:CR=1 FL=1